jgi:anti-sigma regulatory factor (Ser/Thr protein kinase)
VNDAWSGPDGARAGHSATLRWRGARFAPSVERNGGSAAGERRQVRGTAANGQYASMTRPHERRRGEEHGSGTVTVCLDPDDGAPRGAREVVARELAGAVPRERAEDAMLLVSELVTNSVLHAELDDDGWIRLQVTVRDAVVRIDVWDSGDGFRAQAPQLPDADRATGRGLFLVQRLSDRCGLASDGPSRVWFEIDR